MTKIICDMCGKEIIHDPAAVKITIKPFNPMCMEKELHYCSSCKDEMQDAINDNVSTIK